MSQPATEDGSLPPPHDEVAERVLIGSWMLLCDDTAEIRRTRVEPSRFYDGRRALVAQAILACLDDAIPIDPLTVHHQIDRAARDAEQAQAAKALLTECTADTSSPAHAAAYAARVENAAGLRDLLNVAARATQAVRIPGAEAGDIRERLQTDLASAALALPQPLSGKASEHLGQAVTNILTRFDPTGGDGRLSFGVRELDLAGVFVRPGSFPVIAARPGCGKTTFTRRWAFRTARLTGRKVVYLTLEQDPVELVYDEILAEASVADPCGRGVESFEDSDKLTSAVQYLEDVEFYAPSMFPHRLGPLVTWLHQVIAKEKPAAIVIDYLTRVSAPGKDVNERASLISNRLRTVAHQTGCPIVCCAQLNRGSAGDRREPELHDLRDSGQIEQDATCVIMLHYPYALASAEERREGRVDQSQLFLLVKKNRHGRAFARVEMRMEGAYKRMLVSEANRV